MKAARWAWLPVLLLVLACLGWDTADRWRDNERMSASRAADAPAPALDADSPTGYAFGQRRLVIESFTTDGYQWIMQAQQLANGGGFRIRHVDWDNAPSGREAHWNSGLVWWLAGLGWLDHVATGKPLPRAVEEMAPFALPVFLALVLIVFTPVVAWRMGGLAAAAFAGGFVGCWPLYATLAFGCIDHHGPIAVCVALSVLFLAAGGAGWVRNDAMAQSANTLARWLPVPSVARRWFVAAGFFGAAALWMSAATEAPVLVGIGLAVLAISVGMRRAAMDAPWLPAPSLWRVWGIAGAAGSLFFYLLEYFPNGWSWRLEVNHPLYALAWLGAGDVLCRFCTPRNPSESWARRVGKFLPGLAAAAVLPAIIMIAKARVFIPADPFLWLLHADTIQEFQPLIARVPLDILPGVIAQAAHPFLVFAVLVLGLVVLRERPWRALLLVTLAPLGLTCALALAQLRWLNVAAAISVAGLATVVFLAVRVGDEKTRRGRALGCGVLLGVLLLAHPLFLYLPRWLAPFSAVAGAPTLMTRNLAYDLRRRCGAEPVVIVSGFTTTSRMIYFGGFRGVGTGYWENNAGLHAAAEILGARTDEDALAVVKQRGVTHIVDDSVDYFSVAATRLLAGLRMNQEPPAPGFASRLEKGGLPVWLRPVLSVNGRYTAMVYEVDLRQTPQQALVRKARFALEMGAPAQAEKFAREAVKADSRDRSAWIVLANIQQQAENRRADFTQTMQLMAAVSDPRQQLEPADRLGLVSALLAAGNESVARTEAAAVLASLDPRTLRRLSATQLRQALDFSHQWNLPFAAGVTQDFALGLLPKVARPDWARKD